ncbi:MAG TPA: hypothetical protein VF940_20650 [Streptosporangiaceae bacterium]
MRLAEDTRADRTPASYLIDTSGLFRIFQLEWRRAWAEQLAAGVIAVCPIVELEFLHSAAP